MTAIIRTMRPWRFGVLAIASALGLGVLAQPAVARKPEKALAKRIILSTRAFPTRFKNNAAFIQHMRKVDTKSFAFGDKERINVEFMAFFVAPASGVSLEAKVFDITEGRQELVETFAVDPEKAGQRILASGFALNKSSYEPDHTFHMVISAGYRGRTLAETKFVVRE